MATYEFESFVFGSDSHRDPSDLADVFLSKADYGGIVRIGDEVYQASSVDYGFRSGRSLSLRRPTDDARMRITTEDGVLMAGDEVLSDSVSIITSCPSCYAQEFHINSPTQAECIECGETL